MLSPSGYWGALSIANNNWSFNIVNVIKELILSPFGSFWSINAMVQLNGDTAGTITQAHLAVINNTSANTISSYNNWNGGYTSNYNNGWICAATTNNNVLPPALNSTYISCSGIYCCNNHNGNNGAISFALYLKGTPDANGNSYTRIKNAYFYATRIA
jgi:hypothetical protein